MPKSRPSQSPNHPITQSLVITIDGPAGVGKSTAAKLLAQRLNLRYLDTGATYRTLAYAALRQQIDLNDRARLARLGRTLRITLEPLASGGMRVRLGAEDVTRQIRTERVTEAAAVLAQYPAVRKALVSLQRRLARSHGVVAEGRDTGSVVFPQAPYKFFLTANTSVRAKRRQEELRGVQGHAPSTTQIAHKLRERDRLDRTRRIGPLVKPSDAVVVDTSDLGVDDVVKRLLQHVVKNSGCTTGKNSVSYLFISVQSHGVQHRSHDTRS